MGTRTAGDGAGRLAFNWMSGALVALGTLALVPALAQSGAATTRPSAAVSPARAVLEAELHLFLSWFEGRFDNERQVFFADDLQIPADRRQGRIHSIVRKVDLPAFGANVFYVEQYLNGDPAQIHRQSLEVVTADHASGLIKLESHALPDPAAIVGAYRNPGLLAGLTPENSPTRDPGCAVYWRRQENQFLGAIRDAECPLAAAPGGWATDIRADQVLSENAIWIGDLAQAGTGGLASGADGPIPAQLRRVRMFECWTAVLRGASHGDSGEGAEPDNWFFKRGVLVHDQGGAAAVATDETPGRTLRFRLRRVEWPFGPNRPSLTLYVLGEESERAVSYAWADYDADRLGINLRWMQASCTEAPERLWEL